MKYKEEATTLKDSIHNSSGGNDQPKGTFLHIPFMLQLLPPLLYSKFFNGFLLNRIISMKI